MRDAGDGLEKGLVKNSGLKNLKDTSPDCIWKGLPSKWNSYNKDYYCNDVSPVDILVKREVSNTVSTGKQLAADRTRQELVHRSKGVRPVVALDRPDLAAG